MLQTLTVKLKIMPDQASGRLLLDTMAAYSHACSFVADRIAKEHLPFSTYKVHKAVYYDIRSRFLLPSQMAASVIRTVVASYKSIQTAKKNNPSRFSGKKRSGLIVP